MNVNQNQNGTQWKMLLHEQIISLIPSHFHPGFVIYFSYFRWCFCCVEVYHQDTRTVCPLLTPLSGFDLKLEQQLLVRHRVFLVFTSPFVTFCFCSCSSHSWQQRHIKATDLRSASSFSALCCCVFCCWGQILRSFHQSQNTKNSCQLDWYHSSPCHALPSWANAS